MSCQLLAEGLLRTGQFEVTAAASPEHAQQLLDGTETDVLLTSPGPASDNNHGLNFLQSVRKQHPDLSVIVLTDPADKATVVEAFRAGVRGIFIRSDSFAALCKCIVCVHRGQVWASSENLECLLQALAEPMAIASDAPFARPLSQREEEIAQLVTQGCSNRQISERLKLSEHTVKNYLFHAFEKLGVSTRVELTLYALNSGDVRHSKAPPKNAARMVKAETLQSRRPG